MQNLGNNLRFTISVQVTIVKFIIVVFGGKIIRPVVAVSRVNQTSFLVVAGGRAATVAALIARAELYWVPGVCAAKHTALAVLFGMIRGG